MYNIERQHNYNIILEKVKTLKNLSGPIIDIEQRNHAYSEIKKSIESLKTLTGPFYEIDREHSYKVSKNTII